MLRISRPGDRYSCPNFWGVLSLRAPLARGGPTVRGGIRGGKYGFLIRCLPRLISGLTPLFEYK
jgi:hypothetical protein